MIKTILGIAIAVLFLGFSNQAHAQASQAGLSVCASSSLAVTVTTANTQLNKCGHSVVITNIGANEIFYALGVDNTAAATTSSASLASGSSILLDVGDASPYLAAITGTSTSTIRITQGQGMTALSGGGGGGAGGAVTISGSLPAGTNSIGAVTSIDGGLVSVGTTTDAACATDNGNCDAIQLQKRTNQNLTTLNTTAGGALAAGTNAIGSVLSIGSQYPTGAVPITASATGTTATAAATLAHVTGHTVYICGFSIRANANAAATGNATVAGTITATLNFTQWTAVNTTGLGINEQVFMPCVPASGINTDIVVTSAAPGTGGVESVSAWGYSL